MLVNQDLVRGKRILGFFSEVCDCLPIFALCFFTYILVEKMGGSKEPALIFTLVP